jgi:PAS domain S-box-containing protein
MGEPLRVLILEDDPLDAELVGRELSRCGHSLEVDKVADRAGFEEWLARGCCDLVLADYSIPDFDGMEAARLVRESDDLLPVILVTGALDEETAVECMKAGAWDYVLKEHLTRLCPAVSGALRTREALWEKRKSDQKALWAGREWQATFDAIGDGVCLLDRKGAVQRWNRAFTAIVALPGEWIAGLFCCEVLKGGHQGNACVFRRMLENRRRESQEFELAGRWYQETSDPVFDQAGEISSAVYVASDVTGRRNMEDELARTVHRVLEGLGEAGT